ncbi:MAG: DNA-binding protein [Chloroflexia bacterium]|nr:DNA-binding protein [Chloroflexia bacterium]
MGDDFLPLMQAASYLGVSRMKLSRMVQAGELQYVTSPLDKRVKLFRRADLDQLRHAPRPVRPVPTTKTTPSEA